MKVIIVILLSWLLFISTAIANEQVPLYQQLIIQQQKQNNKPVSSAKAEQQAFIALQKRLSKIKKVTPLAPLDVAPFHFRAAEELAQKTQNNSGLCVSCHDNQAHSKSVKLRSFLNMHTKTIACQTCHFSGNKYQLDYQWQTQAGQLVRQIDFVDKKEYLLVPVYQGKSVMPSKNGAFAKELISTWQQAEKAEDKSSQALLWQNIHQPLSTLHLDLQTTGTSKQNKPQVTCTSCHQQTNPRINLAELGADKQRQQRFEQNIIARFFKRYAKEDDKINLLELLK